MRTLGSFSGTVVLILGTIVLFLSTAFGADFALTMGDYRAQIKRRLNVDITNTTYMADSVMNQLIREAIVTVNPQVSGIKAQYRFVTTPNVISYKIDTSIISIVDVWWRAADTVRPLAHMDVSKWSSITHQNTWGGDDPYLQRPSVYDMTDDSIKLFPVPTGYDTIVYDGTQKVTNLMTRDTVITIPQKYRIAILDMATYLVAASKQRNDAIMWSIQADSSIARLAR